MNVVFFLSKMLFLECTERHGEKLLIFEDENVGLDKNLIVFKTHF